MKVNKIDLGTLKGQPAIEQQTDRIYEGLDEVRSIAASFKFDPADIKRTVEALQSIDRQLSAIEQTLTKAAQ